METTIILFPAQADQNVYRVIAGTGAGNKVFEGSYGNASFFAVSLAQDLRWPVKMVSTKIGRALESR